VAFSSLNIKEVAEGWNPELTAFVVASAASDLCDLFKIGKISQTEFEYYMTRIGIGAKAFSADLAVDQFRDMWDPILKPILREMANTKKGDPINIDSNELSNYVKTHQQLKSMKFTRNSDAVVIQPPAPIGATSAEESKPPTKTGVDAVSKPAGGESVKKADAATDAPPAKSAETTKTKEAPGSAGTKSGGEPAKDADPTAAPKK
jgi:hypothetical protein